MEDDQTRRETGLGGGRVSKRPRGKSVPDRSLVGPLAEWYRTNQRSLPWRDKGPRGSVKTPSGRDPYRSLVSELMLQQTQVSRVLEKFGPFIERFPTATALADADEQDVLAAWSGLGYYRRARLLHAAARAIRDQHEGQVPGDVERLKALPGLGRYTAGAIASLVFHEPAPIVDGNVTRVLLRVHGRDGAADEKDTIAWTWERAEALAKVAHADEVIAEFNEGLMELGATVCTPGMPACERCPWAGVCVAKREGKQREIPRAKKSAKRSSVTHEVVVVRTKRGDLLLERRPSVGGKGLWAGMYQAPTVEAAGEVSGEAGEVREGSEVCALLGLGDSVRATFTTSFVFKTTHRDVLFRVYEGFVPRPVRFGPGKDGRERVWKSAAETEGLALSNPMRGILLAGGGLGFGEG